MATKRTKSVAPVVPAAAPADMAALFAAFMATQGQTSAPVEASAKVQASAPKQDDSAILAAATPKRLVEWKTTEKGKPYAVVELANGQKVAIWPSRK